MATPHAIAFGRALKAVREKKGLSQERLALEAELDRTFVSMLERGRRQPTVGTVFALAAVLGVRPSVLVRLTERMLADDPSAGS